MKKRNSLKSFISIEANQEKVNRYFILFLFLLVITNLLWNAYLLIPEDILFFYTCNAVEYFLTAGAAWFFYYKIVRHENLAFKIFSIIGTMVLLLGLAFLKTYRQGHPFSEKVFDHFTSFLGLTFLFIALFYIFDNLNLLINNSYVRTKKALEEAEQQLLRRQFNPHFLYNAFNSLYSMSLQNHPQTSASILELSGMMRYLTDNAQTSQTLLKQEFNFIQNYTRIERIRFGKKANITFQQTGDSSGITIEPLLLITLVENAFKHGFYTNKPGAFVYINSELKDNQLTFTVKNSVFKKQHFEMENRTGTGLNNLRKRLELSYPNNAQLDISEKENEYMATLKINL